MLRGIRRLLAPGGLLYIRVPNDFNPLQLAAQQKLGADPWWIAVPDHVNYFDVDSLCRALPDSSASSRSTCRPTSRWSCSC